MIERLRISTLCSRLRSLIGNFALLGWLRVLDQLADFRHAIFDLPIHEHFAQLQGTAARVALHTGGTQAELRRIRPLAGVAHGNLVPANVLLPYSPQLGSICHSTVTAGRKVVVLEVVLDLPVGLGIGIAGIEHADTLRSEERRVGKEWRSRW